LSVVCLSTAAYFWVSYGRMIEARIVGDQGPVPRIFGRPLELRPGQGLSGTQLIQRLNDVGYAQRDVPSAAGEFGVRDTSVEIVPLATNEWAPARFRVDYARANAAVISRLTTDGRDRLDRVVLEAPLLAALAPGERRRFVPLDNIPRHMIDAVLVIEDRRFYDHPGVDPIGMLRALVTNLSEDRPYLVGGSILAHGIPGAHELVHHYAEPLGAVLAATLPTLFDLLVGVLAGGVVLAGWSGIQRLRKSRIGG
jgi:penicillin-binding protein 1B